MSAPYENVREIMPDGTLLPLERSGDALSESMATTYPNQRDLAVPTAVPAFDPYADENDDEADGEKPSRWRNPLVWGGIVLAAIVVFVALFFVTRPQATPLAYTTGSVAQGNLVLTVSATGPISSGTYNLNFPSNGTVTEIDVKVGDQVKAGQVLAKIDPTSLQDALNSAQQQLKSAQASYNAALVNLQDAENSQSAADAQAQDTYNAATNPATGPTPTAQQIQQANDQLNQSRTQAQNSVNSAQNSVESAALQVQSAQQGVTTAQHNLGGATLTAPIDGEIATVNGNVGASSSGGGSSSGSSGSSSSSAFIQLVNLSSMQVTGQVNEADIGSVNIGWPVSFTVQAFPQDTFHGTVASISPIGQTSSSVVTYPVTVAIDPQSAAQARLFPGMTASMTITTQQAIGVTLVPNTAISYARTAVRNGHLTTAAVQTALAAAQQMIAGSTDLSSGTAGYVTTAKGSTLTAVPIVTGITDGTDTVVLAGLNPGDSVVVGDNQATTTTTTSSSTGTNIFGGGGRSGGGRGGAGGGNGG